MQASTVTLAPISGTPADAGPVDPAVLIEKLRVLAFQRLDREVFNRLRPAPRDFRFGSQDLLVVAATLREATRQLTVFLPLGKPDNDIDELIAFIAGLLERTDAPKRVSNSPPFREYLTASLDWFAALRPTTHVEMFWGTLNSLIHTDLSPMPELRERLVGELAEIGRRVPLPDELVRIVYSFSTKPYLFSDPVQFLRVLAFVLRQDLRAGDFAAVTGRWLPEWRRHISVSTFWRKQRRSEVLVVKDDVHSRLGITLRSTGVLLGRFGGFANVLSLLLIKLDYYIFIRSHVSGTPVGWAWLALLRGLFQLCHWLEPRPLAAETGPEGAEPGIVRGTRHDVLITRMQGGIGDVMTMRPGAVALARRKRRGRVVFATNRSYFPGFSTDDPFDLIDIEGAPIDVASFGKWINLSDCPAVRIESLEFPKVRTDRITIFARAVGVRFWPWSYKAKTPPMTFPPEILQRAEEVVAAGSAPGQTRIGIQLRAAETYKDVPEMLEVARRLAERHAVFVFDHRLIPRLETDRFTAVDNQTLPVAIAMVTLMDAVIAPDSSYLHMAGINRIPCLLAAGPTDGKVRVKPYRNARYLDMRWKLACIACWRHEFNKCALSNGYESICMKLLRPPVVIEALEKLLLKYPPRPR